MNSNKAKDEGSKEKWLTQKKMFSERILIFVPGNDSNFVHPIEIITKMMCLFGEMIHYYDSAISASMKLWFT